METCSQISPPLGLNSSMTDSSFQIARFPQRNGIKLLICCILFYHRHNLSSSKQRISFDLSFGLGNYFPCYKPEINSFWVTEYLIFILLQPYLSACGGWTCFSTRNDPPVRICNSAGHFVFLYSIQRYENPSVSSRLRSNRNSWTSASLCLRFPSIKFTLTLSPIS